MKAEWTIAGAVTSGVASGVLRAYELKRIREGLILIPWSEILPWATSIVAYLTGSLTKKEEAKSFGLGSLLYALGSTVKRLSMVAAAGGERT